MSDRPAAPVTVVVTVTVPPVLAVDGALSTTASDGGAVIAISVPLVVRASSASALVVTLIATSVRAVCAAGSVAPVTRNVTVPAAVPPGVVTVRTLLAKAAAFATALGAVNVAFGVAGQVNPGSVTLILPPAGIATGVLNVIVVVTLVAFAAAEDSVTAALVRLANWHWLPENPRRHASKGRGLVIALKYLGFIPWQQNSWRSSS